MVLLILITAMPVQANTITLANPDGTGNRDVMVYYANGTFYGLYNMTSVITTDTTNNSYIFTFKPQGNNLIDDPGDWLTNTAFPYVRTNIIAIVIMAAMLAIVFTRRR
jgi:hypothetical protein